MKQLRPLFALLLLSSIAFAQQHGAVGSSCALDYECISGADCVSYQCQRSLENGFYPDVIVPQNAPSSEGVGSVPGYAPLPPEPKLNVLSAFAAFAVMLVLIAGYGLVTSKPRASRN